MSLPSYEEYKDSDVEWLGRVPSHWGVDRIKASVASARNGIWGDEPHVDDNDIACVRVADFDRRRLQVKHQIPTMRSVTEKERAGRTLKQGDLLLEKSGGGELQPVGQVVMYQLDSPAICSNFIARVALKQGMRPGYWNFVHSAAYSVGVNLGSINQTSGIQNLDQDRYFNERAPFPPEDEQTVIAAFLDRETAKIDALMAEQEKLIALLAEKRQATISHAVTKGLNPNAPMKVSGVAWLGEVPAHWDVVPLMHLTHPSRPIMYGIVLPGPDFEGGIPIVKGGDVKEHRLKVDLLNRTTAEIEAPYARARLRPGDIVYSIRGTIGDAEVVPPELLDANITQDVARISPDVGVQTRWLLHVMKARPVFVQLEQRSLGAAVRGINIFELKRARIPVPPTSERENIADFLDAETAKLDALGAEAERTIRLLKERRSALVAAAVTGQIDVRGAVEQVRQHEAVAE